MSRKPETVFTVRVKTDLRRMFPDCFVEKIQQRATRGTPDIVACVRGWFIGLEIKTDGGRVTAVQDYVLRKIRLAGGAGLVVTPATWPAILEQLGRLPQRACSINESDI